MRCRVLLALLLSLSLGTVSFGVEGTYFPLTIIRAGQKTRDRIVYWVVDTPLYHEDPYFEVAVRTSRAEVVAEREPQSRYELLPEEWKPGVIIQGRLDQHHLFLRRPNGTEVRFIITHRTKTSIE
jgi:hypothetical protein